MAKIKLGLGSRYGKKIREKLIKIKILRNSSKQCPYCKKDSAKRIASGLWFCKACKTKFTGKAYTIE